MKILIHSDDPRAHTGYGTQARKMAQIFRRLGHHTIFSAQFSNEATMTVVDIDGIAHNVYGMGKGKFIDPNLFHEIFDREKFDLLITMADWQMIDKMMEVKPEVFCRWICYCAADGNMLTTRWDYLIQEIPYMVFFTPQFGEQVVSQRRLGYVEYCPLTVDPEVFKPLPDRKEIAAKAKESMGWPKDCKTVLTVARNQWRKNYPEIVVAAKQLEKIHPGKFRFVFHCRPQEDFGWDLPQLLNYYDAQRLIAISDRDIGDAELNHVYNSADMFLLPSQGEGFGVPLVEAALCELPVVTTGATANLDVARMLGWEDYCLTFQTVWQNGPTIPRPTPRAADIFEGLFRVELNRNLEPLKTRGRELAIDEFGPQVAVKKWDKILTEAANIVNMRIGGLPFLGGKTYIDYQFPTLKEV